MNKTRILSLLLVLVMMVSCLASCNIGGGGTDTPSGGGTDTPGTEGGTGEKPNFGGGEQTTQDWYDSITYDETNLIFQMTDCSNNQELPSGCQRFLAGKAEASLGQSVDDLVEQRNTGAYETTNVTVTYQYYPDDHTLYGYSKCFDLIYTEVKNHSSASPDMYCNFMTDMLVTSLKGSFANLYSEERGIDSNTEKNYFNLKDPGYMADLMGSLTLSSEKVYVVASDYFLDLIRAFFIVPVNVSLYNQIAPDTIEDLNGDGVSDVNDIFEEVWKGDWIYDRVAEYSAKIWQEGTAGVAGDSVDDILGFGLGDNGLPAAGLVYTSSVVVIHKEWQDAKGAYKYWYEPTNQSLVDLANAVNTLVGKTGVAVISGTDASSLGEDSPLKGVRNKFVNNQMLFGGIILVGSLEYDEYQQMKKTDGFAVVPVPLYAKTYNDSGEQDMYLTQIHVVGRAGGISARTSKFVQCSAFLQYQSSNSTDVLNEYYDLNLMYDIANGVDGNVDMLKYIRQNVRTSFDKLYEDAIGFLAPDGVELSDDTRWHTMLVAADFQKTDMSTSYEKYVGLKTQSLDNLVASYSTLPN